jgi:uncharacterized membrane protein YfhO
MAISEPSFDPFEVVVLEGESRPWIGGSGELLALSERGPNQLELEVDAPDGGWLVVADSWFPGWSANVDGELAKIYPANAAFRAVWMAPGVHQVVMAYKPISLTAGALLTGLGLAIVVVIRKR